MRLATITAIGVILAGTALAAVPFVGTWKMRAKATGKLASRTVTEVQTGKDEFADTYTDVAKTGQKTTRKDPLICDGKEHAVPNEKFTLTCKQIDRKTRTIVGKQDGKTIQEIRHVLPDDGKSMTVRNVQTGNETVYDRQ